jgi:hypothetical protein
MGIPIHGITREVYDATPTETTGGSRPFPFNEEWHNYTARVDEVSIAIDQNGGGNDQLLIRASNGNYAVRFYLNLDPSILGDNFQGNRDEAIQKNLDKLVFAAKCLDLAVWGNRGMEIEPKRFGQAENKVITFGIVQSLDRNGMPKKNQKGYPVAATRFGGLAKALEPVVEPAGYQAPAPPRQQAASGPAPVQRPLAGVSAPDDIPF